MSLIDTVTDLVAPVLSSLGVELIDVEHHGAVVRVVVDEPGGGISLDRLATVTQAVSTVLDERDPLPGTYTLEVSSPGVERPLRAPRHFRAAIGEKITMRVLGDRSARRVTGELLDADDEAITVAVEAPAGGADADQGPERITYANIDRARTVFEWGPGPKPGKGSKPGAAKGRTRKPAARGTSASTRSGGSA